MVPISDGSTTVRFPICTDCHDKVHSGDMVIDEPVALVMLQRLKERGIIDNYLLNVNDTPQK